MPVAVVEEKIRRLPEYYVVLVNNYIDQLLEKAAESLNSNVEKKQEKIEVANRDEKLPFERFEKYFGMVPADFDIEKAKAEYFEEKYGRFD